MSDKKIDLKEIVELTKQTFHSYYSGDTELWFSHLCPKSIYIGTNEPILFGGKAVREHFEKFPKQTLDIIQEEYYPISLGRQAANVVGQVIVKSTTKQPNIIIYFTVGYQIINGELKVVHQHNSYEQIQSIDNSDRSIPQLNLNSIHFIRNLLLDSRFDYRIPIRSGNQTIFVNPYTVLYVQSQRKRTEIVCLDKIISCNNTIGELSQILPDFFYKIHRCYLVNTLYIVAIRRFEAELISGISVPIPALSYTQTKQDLQKIISGK